MNTVVQVKVKIKLAKRVVQIVQLVSILMQKEQ